MLVFGDVDAIPLCIRSKDVNEIVNTVKLLAGSFGGVNYPNQVNNVLAFPGVFRGALDSRAMRITENMKVAAAYAIANLINLNELSCDNILPMAFDPNVKNAVATAVAEAAHKDGVSRN